MSGGRAEGATVAADRFAAAHAALRSDPAIQFVLPPASIPKLPEMPPWLVAFLKWLGNGIRWLTSFMPNAPYARIFLWTMLGLAAAAILWTVYERIRYGEWRLPRRRRPRTAALDLAEEWAPDAAPVHAWLAEADALAAQGRFAEAVHHLLFRSVEDIARRRPRLVRPALTSRELASAEAVPAGARGLFARIARLVERSFFGGRPVGAEDWASARAAYTDFALPAAWRA